MPTPSSFADILSSHRPSLGPYEDLYKHLHAHPELSDQESETAKLIVSRLRQLSPDLAITTDIGGHGLFAVLSNGGGPTVLLRADFDALPLKEKTGLDYASTVEARDSEGLVRGVMHGESDFSFVECFEVWRIEEALRRSNQWSNGRVN